MVLFEIILWFDCYSSEPSEPRFYSRLLTTGTFPSNSVPGTQTTHKVHKTHFQVQGFKLEPPIEKNRSFKKLPSLQPCKIYSKIGHFFVSSLITVVYSSTWWLVEWEKMVVQLEKLWDWRKYELLRYPSITWANLWHVSDSFKSDDCINLYDVYSIRHFRRFLNLFSIFNSINFTWDHYINFEIGAFETICMKMRIFVLLIISFINCQPLRNVIDFIVQGFTDGFLASQWNKKMQFIIDS